MACSSYKTCSVALNAVSKICQSAGPVAANVAAAGSIAAGSAESAVKWSHAPMGQAADYTKLRSDVNYWSLMFLIVALVVWIITTGHGIAFAGTVVSVLAIVKWMYLFVDLD